MIGQYIPDQQDDDPRKRIAEAILLAQATPKAGMQKQYIENDPDLYGPRPSAPAAPTAPPTAPQGQRPQGQVGMTTLSPEKEAILRAQLRELRPNLPQSAYDDMVAAHKAAKGLR